MKNAYLTSHFPLFSIVLFSLSFSIYVEQLTTSYLIDIGLYSGMTEFFSEKGIHLTILFLLWLFFFMLFSALKLLATTMNEVSLLFFSKDEEGSDLKRVRAGTWIFLIASVLTVLTSFQIQIMISIFFVACIIYFIYFVYCVSYSLSSPALFGMIFFHIFFWFSFILAVIYAILKLYNSFIASLPI